MLNVIGLSAKCIAMKKSNFLTFFFVCFIGQMISCTTKVQTPSKKDLFYNPFVQTESVRIVNMQKWSSNYSLDQEYYLDYDSLSQSEFYAAIEDDQVGHMYEYITDPKLIQADREQDTIKPKMIFHYQSQVFGFTAGYIDQHLFIPEFIDLHINEYDNLFLSLGTNQKGNMNAAIYNKENGFRVGVFSDNNYNGSFLRGQLVQHLDSVKDVTVALVIGDSLYFRDYTLDHLLDDN